MDIEKNNETLEEILGGSGEGQEPVTPPETEEPGGEVTPPSGEDTPPAEDDSNKCKIYTNWIYQTIPHFYDRVRVALNVGSLMDDTTIDFFENAPMAELKIKERIPNYEELDSIKRLLFETCIIYMTCYALCPVASTMRITRQKDPSLELEFAASSSKESPCDRFLAMVDDLINQINEEEVTSFFGFRVTKGSGCNVVKPCWPYHGPGAYTPLWSEKQ